MSRKFYRNILLIVPTAAAFLSYFWPLKQEFLLYGIMLCLYFGFMLIDSAIGEVKS